MSIEHRAGKLHSHVDTLSRLPVQGEHDSQYDIDVPNVAAMALIGWRSRESPCLVTVNRLGCLHAKMTKNVPFLRSCVAGADDTAL